MIAEIFDGIEMLETFPKLGRNGIVKRTRELPIGGTPYIAVYRVRKTTIDIIAVFHRPETMTFTIAVKLR